MRAIIFSLTLSLLCLALPLRAAEEPAPETAAPEKRAERPQREALKLSPKARESAPRPDESGKLRKVAPRRGESPLQHVPALMDPPPMPPGQAPAKP